MIKQIYSFLIVVCIMLITVTVINYLVFIRPDLDKKTLQSQQDIHDIHEMFVSAQRQQQEYINSINNQTVYQKALDDKAKKAEEIRNSLFQLHE